jgi:hypothetical protein
MIQTFLGIKTKTVNVSTFCDGGAKTEFRNAPLILVSSRFDYCLASDATRKSLLVVIILTRKMKCTVPRKIVSPEAFA